MTARWMVAAVALAATGAAADVWTEPNPWRRDAVLEGRDYNYTREAFVHRESYRHRSVQPATDVDGLRGTVGSVSGDELYTDVHLLKTFRTDDDRFGFFVRMQRFEDFDGHFDRQVVGVQARVGSAWQVAVAGDVKGSKAETDVQLEARWQPDDYRLLRLVVAASEPFHNDKDGAGEFDTQPYTAFAHYRRRSEAGGVAELVVNHSPWATFETADGSQRASGRQTRLMTRGEVPFGGRRVGARLELEQTRRRFGWRQSPAPDADDFRRDMGAATLYTVLDDVRFTPQVGVRYFNLKEDGWFGSGFASTGRVRRDELIAYAGVIIPAGLRQSWEPTVYVDFFDVSRRFAQVPQRNSERDGWVGKLAVPWRYVVNEANDAVLTVNLTFRLHTAQFGGGNVQLHWPL